MAMTEHEGLQIYKDASGNSFILYPITKVHLVDGFEEAVMALAGIEDGLAKFAHTHAAGDISSGELAADRLPVVPISKGGTGANTAAAALEALGVPAAVSELIAESGAARIQVGSYVGTGKYGSSNPNKLTFGFVPKMVLIGLDYDLTGNWTYAFSYEGLYIAGLSKMRVFTRAKASGSATMGDKVPLKTASGNVLEWYNTSSAPYQLNDTNLKYVYVAIG